jgi:hypothetical protein
MVHTSRSQRAEFHISPGGIFPELGQSYHYIDDSNDFWFYVEYRSPPKVQAPALFVQHASTGRYKGRTPRVAHADRVLIENNIRKYFQEFDLLDRPISTANPALPVLFGWRLGE